ncbi:MAG: hypothetical protein ACXWV0_08930 [Flavisolibacter sp.]
MTIKFIYAILIVLSLTACKSGPAFEYNQKLVKIENSLLPDVEKASQKISAFIEKENFDSMALVSQEMVRILDKKIDEVRKLPAPEAKEAENFKKGYINYFEFMRSIYLSYKNFAVEQTEEARQKMISVENRRNAVIAELQAVQRQYAKANGFKMEGE